MTDDAALIARLNARVDGDTRQRRYGEWVNPDGPEAAARIEALVREKDMAWKTQVDMSERYIAASREVRKFSELADANRRRAEAAEAELDDWRVRAIKAEENDRISREWLAAAEARADALAKELAETQERLHNRTEQLTATAKELAEAREERDALAAAIRLMRDDTAIRRG